jgi:cardiolipin synthase A/B
VNARQGLETFLTGAKKELLIYDVDIADREILRILQERLETGVQVKIIGHVSRSKRLSARVFKRMRLHTRVVIRDCKQAFLGSQSMRKLELDGRREIGMIVNNAKVVGSLITVFEDDWKASTPADRRADKKRVSAKAERTSRKVTKAVRRKLAPGPVVQQVVKVIEKEAKVEVDRAEASEMVKGALAKAVKKTAAKIVEEAVAE